MDAYKAKMLPLSKQDLDVSIFLDEIIDATAKLEVYKEKVKDSKLANEWFLPTLQQKEAWASSMLEGTQATLDGVFTNQVLPDEKDKDLRQVINYFNATGHGYKLLKHESFSKELILELHKQLMSGNIRKTSDEIGEFRTRQNYVAKTQGSKEITYIPPVHTDIASLMDNLVDYMVKPQDSYRPLVRAAIMHAQFLTIHPFMDGNGRVGRILIPLYLYHCGQIELPCFFISETLERDKFKYYKLLNDIRLHNRWNEWIKFFLGTIISQCDKYLNIVNDINTLYDKHVTKACELFRSSKIIDLINLLYKFPVITAATVAKEAKLPLTTANRYLSILVQNNILYSNEKSRNRTYFYYDLLAILR